MIKCEGEEESSSPMIRSQSFGESELGILPPHTLEGAGVG